VRKHQKVALVSIIAVLMLAAAWYQFGGHRTAPGQLPLAELNNASLEQLRADFNAAVDQPRMIVLLSPT